MHQSILALNGSRIDEILQKIVINNKPGWFHAMLGSIHDMYVGAIVGMSHDAETNTFKVSIARTYGYTKGAWNRASTVTEVAIPNPVLVTGNNGLFKIANREKVDTHIIQMCCQETFRRTYPQIFKTITTHK